jgi:hypothetical protein
MIRPILLLVVGSWLFAHPLFAYVVYLKDGSRILAKGKYVVQGDRALITLPSGQTSSLPLSEIDVPRTEEANRQIQGDVLVIEGGKVQELQMGQAPSPKPTLQDLIRQTGKAPAPPPPTTRPRDGSQVERPARPDPRAERSGPASEPRPTPKATEPEASLASSPPGVWLLGFLTDRKVRSEVTLTGPGKLRVAVSCTTETEVLRAVVATAAGLEDLQKQFPGQVAQIQLELRDPDGGSAGKFTLTPEKVADLLSGRLDAGGFFVRYVEF